VDTESGQIRDTISKTADGGGSFRYSGDVVERVLQKREAALISNRGEEKLQAELNETMKFHNVKSVMCVPIISRTKLYGVLYADSLTSPYVFGEKDLRLLSALSSPVALAIENIQLASEGQENS
jgi:GAF domain-containing protein